MKKIIAVVLLLASVFALASCSFGSGIKKYRDKDEVKVDTFVEEITEDVLKKVSDADFLKKSFKAEITATEIEKGTKKYASDKKDRYNEKTVENTVIKYNSSDDEASIKRTTKEYNKAKGLFGFEKQSGTTYLVGSGKELHTMYKNTKMYNSTEIENGVQLSVASTLNEYIGEYTSTITALTLNDKANFYIDDDVYTAVLEEKDDDGVTTKTVVQIIVEDDKYTCIFEKTVSGTNDDDKNVTDTYELITTVKLVLKFKDVNVKAPSTSSYTKTKTATE